MEHSLEARAIHRRRVRIRVVPAIIVIFAWLTPVAAGACQFPPNASRTVDALTLLHAIDSAIQHGSQTSIGNITSGPDSRGIRVAGNANGTALVLNIAGTSTDYDGDPKSAIIDSDPCPPNGQPCGNPETTTFPGGGSVDMMTSSAFVLPLACQQCSALAPLGGKSMSMGDLAAVAFRKHDGTFAWRGVQAGDSGNYDEFKEIAAGTWAFVGERIFETVNGKTHWYHGVDHADVRMVIFPGTTIGTPRGDQHVQEDVTCLLKSRGLLK